MNYYASTICTETSVMSLTFFSELICVSTICTERDNFSFHLTFTEHETLILSTIACIIIRPTFSPSNFRNCDPSCIIDSHDGPASRAYHVAVLPVEYERLLVADRETLIVPMLTTFQQMHRGWNHRGCDLIGSSNMFSPPIVNTGLH